MSRLCSDYPLLSLTRAPGVPLWKAARVLWSCSCEAVFHKTKFTVDDHLCILHPEALKWLAMPNLSLDHEAVHLYAAALHGWLTDHDIPVCPDSDVASQKRPPPPPSPATTGLLLSAYGVR